MPHVSKKKVSTENFPILIADLIAKLFFILKCERCRYVFMFASNLLKCRQLFPHSRFSRRHRDGSSFYAIEDTIFSTTSYVQD